MARPKKITPKYFLTLRLGKETYSSDGETAVEAIEKLPKPEKIFLSGFLTLEYKGKKREQRLNIPRIKSLFMPLRQWYLAKQLTIAMK